MRNCDLRHLAVGRDTGQEADNDQKRTPQSLQTAYVNKSTGSHRSQTTTEAEQGRSFRPTPPTSHPLSDTGTCTPARLMSATSSQVYSARHRCRCDVPFDRYLAAPAAQACDAIQWWEANAHHVSRSSICLFRPPPQCSFVKAMIDYQNKYPMFGDQHSFLPSCRTRYCQPLVLCQF